MFPRKKIARLAGFVYLITVITGTFSLGYVPGKLINWDDAAQTVENIKAYEWLFRLEILSSILCYVTFVFLPLVLYKLLREVNENIAKLMVILALVGVPLSLLNLQNKLGILTLIGDATYLKTFGTAQLQAQVMLHLSQYGKGLLISKIFWGLWLFPFGWLVYKSGFLPRILGIFLMLGCIGYLVNVFGEIMMPQFSEITFSNYVTLPASVGEIGTCLWLLIMGARNKSVLQSRQQV